LAELLTPERIAGSSEQSHQMAFAQWVALQGRHELPDLELMFAIPNGEERTPSVAARLKAQLVRRGVPDLFWSVPAGEFHGLYIEMKRPALRPRTPQGADGRSDEQQVMGAHLQAQGYAVVVAYDWLEAVAVVRWYHGLRRGF